MENVSYTCNQTYSLKVKEGNFKHPNNKRIQFYCLVHCNVQFIYLFFIYDTIITVFYDLQTPSKMFFWCNSL